jgi:hypothetical protein
MGPDRVPSCASPRPALPTRPGSDRPGPAPSRRAVELETNLEGGDKNHGSEEAREEGSEEAREEGGEEEVKTPRIAGSPAKEIARRKEVTKTMAAKKPAKKAAKKPAKKAAKKK